MKYEDLTDEQKLIFIANAFCNLVLELIGISYKLADHTTIDQKVRLLTSVDAAQALKELMEDAVGKGEFDALSAEGMAFIDEMQKRALVHTKKTKEEIKATLQRVKEMQA